MKDRALKNILIILIAATIMVVVGHLTIRMIFKDSLLNKLVPFITKWEGGLSRDPADTASSHPAPWSYKGKTGWHTNKGVTYATFKSAAARHGFANNAKNFFEMPDWIWIRILKDGFMRPWPLDQIDHLPRIQAVIITWAWGSGNGGAERRLANFQREVMGIVDSNITKAEIVANFNKRITPLNERAWFLKLCDRREADFKTMSTWNVHGRGWINRLNDFRKLMG